MMYHYCGVYTIFEEGSLLFGMLSAKIFKLPVSEGFEDKYLKDPKDSPTVKAIVGVFNGRIPASMSKVRCPIHQESRAEKQQSRGGQEIC